MLSVSGYTKPRKGGNAMSATTSPLMMKIEACLPNMSHAETLVANYILAHPS